MTTEQFQHVAPEALAEQLELELRELQEGAPVLSRLEHLEAEFRNLRSRIERMDPRTKETAELQIRLHKAGWTLGELQDLVDTAAVKAAAG